MDYEKAYKEALERAKAWHNCEHATIDDKILLKRIFPELKVSEDEKIMKELIDFIKGQEKVSSIETSVYQSWIAWIEKHGEQKPDTDFSDLRTWKYIVDAVLTAKDGIGQYLDNSLVKDIAKRLQDRFGAVELAQDCNKKNETKLDKIMAIADSMPRATLKLSPTDHAVSRDLERRIKAATRIVDKEFVNKELDKAAVDFYLKHIQENRYSIDSTGTSLVKEMAKFGAEWQKEQMSKNAIPGTILVNRYGNKYVEGWSGLVQYNEFEQNDKVKILIFKEE